MFEDFYESKRDAGVHFYYEKGASLLTETDVRLQLKYQIYKSSFFLDGKKEDSLYPELFTVDYGQDDFKGRYVTDLSFSFLHWNLMEKLESGDITVDKIDSG